MNNLEILRFLRNPESAYEIFLFCTPSKSYGLLLILEFSWNRKSERKFFESILNY